MSGAIAMIGIVWLATMSGRMARSSIRTWTSRIAEEHPDRRAECEPDRGIAQREERRSQQPGDRGVTDGVLVPELAGDGPDVRQLDVGREANVSGGS